MHLQFEYLQNSFVFNPFLLWVSGMLCTGLKCIPFAFDSCMCPTRTEPREVRSAVVEETFFPTLETALPTADIAAGQEMDELEDKVSCTQIVAGTTG